MARTPRPKAVTDIQVEIGQRLQWARELVEPNRSAFARACGVHPSTVTKIEAGTRPPSFYNLIDFATHLRVSTDYFLRGSMLGVDRELAEQLLLDHPELRVARPQRNHESAGTESTDRPGGTFPKPRKRGGAAA